MKFTARIEKSIGDTKMVAEGTVELPDNAFLGISVDSLIGSLIQKISEITEEKE